MKLFFVIFILFMAADNLLAQPTALACKTDLTNPEYDKATADFLRNNILINGDVLGKPAALATWVAAQNTKTTDLLKTNPLYEQIKARNLELNTTNPAPAYQFGSEKIYLKAGSLVYFDGATENTLVDKATLNGSVVADFKVSPDHTKILFAVAKNGSDSNYWQVYDLKNKVILADQATRVRIYPVSWNASSTGFFYSHWPALEDEFNFVKTNTQRTSTVGNKLHILGTAAGDDLLVFSNPMDSAVLQIDELPNQNLLAHRVKSGFLHPLHAFIGRKNQTSGEYGWQMIRFPYGTTGRFISATDQNLLFLSSEVGSNLGVVSYSTKTGRFLKTIIPATNQMVSIAQRIENKIVLHYFSKDYKNTLKIFSLDGKLEKTISFKDLGLPSEGSLPQSFTGDAYSTNMQFVYSGMGQPSVTINYDVTTQKIAIIKSSNNDLFNSSVITLKQHQIASFDRVKIPVQFYFRSDLAEPKFVYVYYYGSNGIANTAGFNKKFQLMLELGGAVALVGARGGAEYGSDWFKAGMNDRLTTAKDIVWATRGLKKLYPSIGSRTIAAGRSYGGMMTNTVLTQFSEDFDIFVPIVSIADLRYYQTDYFGSVGSDDLGYVRDLSGRLIKNCEAEKKLATWDPIRNLSKIKNLKAVISFTANSDERTGPQQTYLMTSELQRRFPQSQIYMAEHNGGHVARAEPADEATFVSTIFGITELKPLKK